MPPCTKLEEQSLAEGDTKINIKETPYMKLKEQSVAEGDTKINIKETPYMKLKELSLAEGDTKNKIKETPCTKLKEPSLAEEDFKIKIKNTKVTDVELYGRDYSYTLVYPDGRTLSVHVCDDEEPYDEPLPTVESVTERVYKLMCSVAGV